MEAATPPDIDGKVTRFTSWHILSEEQYANRMRILRELCVETEGTCFDQFFKVMGQVDDWEWEDLNPEKLQEDKHVSNRTQAVLSAFSNGQLFALQSPPPGSAAVGSVAAEATGAALSAIPLPMTPGELLHDNADIIAKNKADMIAKNKANALMVRDSKMAVDKQKREDAMSGTWL